MKAENPRHCLTAHQPNSAFEGTRVKLCTASPSLHRRAPQRGRWAQAGKADGLFRDCRQEGCSAAPMGLNPFAPRGISPALACANGFVLRPGPPLSRGRGASRFCMAASPGLP